MQIFNIWLKRKIGRFNIGKIMNRNLIGPEVIGDREVKWTYVKGGLK